MADGSPRPSSLQRARGRAAVTFERGADGRSRLNDLYQSGAAKAMMPRIFQGLPEVVFLNVSGGLTGGDQIEYRLDLGAGCRIVATTQTAERAYASATGTARLDVTLNLGAGAALDWLPQETILFEHCDLTRRTRADLAAGARFLTAELVVLGRAAMGETVADPRFGDWREIRREGRPVLIEPLRLSAQSLAAGPACLGGARVCGSLALVAPGAEDALTPLEAALTARAAAWPNVEWAASAWDGRLVLRLIAAESLNAKALLVAALDLLRGARLPRVWQM